MKYLERTILYVISFGKKNILSQTMLNIYQTTMILLYVMQRTNPLGDPSNYNVQLNLIELIKIQIITLKDRGNQLLYMQKVVQKLRKSTLILFKMVLAGILL